MTVEAKTQQGACLSFPFTNAHTRTQNTSQEAELQCVRVIVLCGGEGDLGGGGGGGGYYEPTEWRPIGLTRLPALNNRGVKGRKEERGKNCSLLGQTSALHCWQEAGLLKMYKHGLMTCLCLIVISKCSGRLQSVFYVSCQLNL